MTTQATTPVLSAEEARAEWLATRRTFIGGSEITELFNIPQYGKGCARALIYRKNGVETDIDDSPDDQLMQRGQIMEPIAAMLYEDKTNRKVRRPAMNEHGLPIVQRHKDLPFLGVHTDRFILAGHGDVRETGDLEIKSHGEGPWYQIQRKGVPPGHPLQVQHSMLVTGHAWGSFAMIGVFGSLPLDYFDLARDEQTINKIKARATQVWELKERGELPDQLPDADDTRCLTCAYRQVCRGKEVDASAVAFFKKSSKSKDNLVQIADAELTKDVGAFRILQDETKALEEATDLLKAKIRARVEDMGITDGDGYVFPGIGKVTLRTTSWSGLDQKRLKLEKPDTYKEFFIEGRPSETKSLRLWPYKA